MTNPGGGMGLAGAGSGQSFAGAELGNGQAGDALAAWWRQAGCRSTVSLLCL